MISYDYSNKETNIYFPTDKTLIDTHTEIGDFSSYFYMMKFTPWIRRVLILPSRVWNLSKTLLQCDYGWKLLCEDITNYFDENKRGEMYEWNFRLFKKIEMWKQLLMKYSAFIDMGVEKMLPWPIKI